MEDLVGVSERFWRQSKVRCRHFIVDIGRDNMPYLDTAAILFGSPVYTGNIHM